MVRAVRAAAVGRQPKEQSLAALSPARRLFPIFIDLTVDEAAPEAAQLPPRAAHCSELASDAHWETSAAAARMANTPPLPRAVADALSADKELPEAAVEQLLTTADPCSRAAPLPSGPADAAAADDGAAAAVEEPFESSSGAAAAFGEVPWVEVEDVRLLSPEPSEPQKRALAPAVASSPKRQRRSAADAQAPHAAATPPDLEGADNVSQEVGVLAQSLVGNVRRAQASLDALRAAIDASDQLVERLGAQDKAQAARQACALRQQLVELEQHHDKTLSSSLCASFFLILVSDAAAAPAPLAPPPPPLYRVRSPPTLQQQQCLGD